MSVFTDQLQVLLDARDILRLQPHTQRRKVQIAWLGEVYTEHKKLGKCKYSSSGECEAVLFARSVLVEESA